MHDGRRTWWTVGKALLAILILIALGRQFVRDLQIDRKGLAPGVHDLWQQLDRPGWLAVSGVLYLLGLGFSLGFWVRLLHRCGQRPALGRAVRAYYLGHFGKYLPGKAWALLLRATLVRRPEVRLGVAALTAVYEVLVTMAAGVLLAAVLFALLAPAGSAALDWQRLGRLLLLIDDDPAALDRWVLVLLALVLLAPVGIPVLPFVFDRLAERVTRPFRASDAAPLPRMGSAVLAEGLLLTSCGWLLQGISVWAALQAVLPEPAPLTLDAWGRYAAGMAVAYVAGFVFLLVPNGVGVREFFLKLFLVPELLLLGLTQTRARELAVLTAVLLRLAWTLAELLLAAFIIASSGRPRLGTAPD